MKKKLGLKKKIISSLSDAEMTQINGGDATTVIRCSQVGCLPSVGCTNTSCGLNICNTTGTIVDPSFTINP